MPNTHGPSPMEATPKPRAGEHTKGPWRTIADREIITIDGEQVGYCYTSPKAEASARRIVACVNYLEGFKTEDLEQRHDNQASLLEERDLLRERERELVEALDQCSDMLEDAYITNEDAAKAYGITAAVKRARTLLAKHGR